MSSQTSTLVEEPKGWFPPRKPPAGIRTSVQNAQPRESESLFNVITATSNDLQILLRAGKILSTQIVGLYLDHIEKNNKQGLKLNAMICTAPHELLMKRARRLDKERAEKRAAGCECECGPLHGIPVTVKDNIMTGPALGMPTTVGSIALKNAMAKENAPVIDMLLEAGAIILGKANLSEMTGYKGFGVTVGWSALGGQTQTPYVIGGFKESEKLLGHSTPGGSSSGSAVGVAAGFAPLAVATETDGSIVQPANRAALFGIKATVGSISTKGSAPWSRLTDSMGCMAKSADDLATLFGVLMNGIDFESQLTRSWKGQRVGFVDPELWEFSSAICDRDAELLEYQRAMIAKAAKKIRKHGAVVKDHVPLTSMDELVLDGEDALEQLWNHDFAPAWAEYLTGYQDLKINTIADIVSFNKSHEMGWPQKYPGQQLLEMALDNRFSDDKYEEGVSIIRKAANINGIQKTLADFELDVIIGPMDGRIPTIAAAAGAPVGTMPLGYSTTKLSNGRPFGVCIIAAAGQEDKIIRAMSAWDATMEKRKPPPQLYDPFNNRDELQRGPLVTVGIM